jgi:putative iron-dependent peroxidase
MHSSLFQSSVLTPISDYASFLIIHFDEMSKLTQIPSILKQCSLLPQWIHSCREELRTGQLEEESNKRNDKELILFASIGFGIEFMNILCPEKKFIQFPQDLSSRLGSMPKTGGDIFLHVKSNRMDACFELSNMFVKKLKRANISIKSLEHTMAFLYKKNQFYRNGMGRDLSQFEDGTENPKTLEEKKEVLSSPELVPGACFALTQKWLHKNLEWFETRLSVKEQEDIIGRTKKESIEIEDSKKSSNAHIARVVITDPNNPEKELEIVRQSMTYGNVKKNGLFFIGFTSDLNIINRMLYRMVGKDNIKSEDSHFIDHILLFSEAISGQYWYIPSIKELITLQFCNADTIITSKL